MGEGRRLGRNQSEEIVIARLRGHMGLNGTLHRVGQPLDGKCEHCGEIETVQHVLKECRRYGEESVKGSNESKV